MSEVVSDIGLCCEQINLLENFWKDSSIFDIPFVDVMADSYGKIHKLMSSTKDYITKI